MKRRKIVVALLILVVAAVCGSYALAQKETGRRVNIKLAAAKGRQDVGALREAIHLQSEMMGEPLLAGQIAIMRIKDIALASKNSDVGVKTLLTIVTSTDHPALKRSALMAAGELYEKSGNPTAAIKMMAEIVKLSRERREMGLAEMDRRLDRRAAELKDLAERLERHRRELDERAGQLERRSRELDRGAERFDRRRRERPEGRREGDERRERAERREGKERKEREERDERED